MDLDHVQVFLTLCEELHFGRTAERLYLSQPRVSRLIAALETEIGGTLFERTNRRVRLTPLGSLFEARLRPAYAELIAARDAARSWATGTDGTLRIAFTTTTEGPGLTRLVDTFSRQHPDCTVSLVEVNIADPYGPLRSGDADLLYNWLAVDEPDLGHSMAVEHQGRMLVVSRNDPLTRHQTVTTDQLVGRPVPVFPGIPDAIYDAFYPPPVLAEALARTRAEPADGPHRVHSMGEVWALVARGQAIHSSATSLTARLTRNDIALLPITDLPPLPLGLIWKRTNENSRIHAFVSTAEAFTAPAAHRRAPPERGRRKHDF